MGREPVNLIAARAGGKPYGRQAMWEAMRALRSFTLLELAVKAGCRSVTAIDYLRALVRGGYLAPRELRAVLGGGRERVYALVKDTGVEAPRLDKKGQELPPSAQQRMWEAMKVLSWFTASDIASHASVIAPPVPVATAERYMKHLSRAAYLSEGGVRRGETEYRLIRNTGGAAPMVQRTKIIFDPNLHTVFIPEGLQP